MKSDMFVSNVYMLAYSNIEMYIGFSDNLENKMGSKSSKEKNDKEGVDDSNEDGESNVSESERRVNALLGANAPSEEEDDMHEREGILIG